MDPSLPETDALAALSAARPGELTVLPGGARLAVRKWGRGPPVLCLHAVGHASADFAGLAARLGEEFELIAPDWPGMGRSPADGLPVRADRFAVLALELADVLGLDRPLVIGSSIGGAAAIVAAAKAPDRFAGLVLCNPGGLAPLDPTARFVIGRMAAFFHAGARGARWFPAVFEAYYTRLVLPRAAEHARRIAAAGPALAPLLADAWEGFAERGATCAGWRLDSGPPVWLAWARSDRFVSWNRARKAVSTIPRRRVTLFRGGHCAFLEDADAFADGFRAFVSDARADRFA